MKRIVTLLIAVAMVVGMLGCSEFVDDGPVSYELTVSSTSGGSVVEPGEGVHIYEEVTVVDLVAEPDTGYRFVIWTGDVGTVANTDSASTTITMNDRWSITANFEEIPAIKYNLSISSSSGGSVAAPGEGTFSYDVGTVVQLAAEALEGYRFAEWTGDVGTVAGVDAAATTIIMNDDYTVMANFVAQYTLTIDSTDGGHVTNPGDGTFTYDAGSVVELVAEVWDGYKFLNWTGDVNTIDDVDAAATTVTMEGNYTITAGFLEAHLYLDQIGPGLWGEQSSGEGVKVTVTDEGVVVSFASDQEDYPGAVFGGGGYSLFALQGDFDIRMGYELTTWPHHSGVRVGLIVLEGEQYTPDRFANIERTGFGEHDLEFSFPGEPAEVYLVNFDEEVSGLIGTDDLAGTLRVSRQGDILTGYYETSEGWAEIYRAEWSTGNVIIRVFTWSSGHTFGGEEVGVLLRTVEIVEPAS